MSFEYDTSQRGFLAVLKDYKLMALQVVWSNPEGANSRIVWQKVNSMLKTSTISRASIINFLEAMRKMGVLNGIERTGKGGHQWVYSTGMNESQFKEFIAKTLLESLMKNFPDETRKVIDVL